MQNTSIEELEKVHLRFIRVNDDNQLTGILSKILPNIIMIFLDQDLGNANLENAKVKQLEQILGHLMMRVKNSPKVIPPHTALLDIFNNEKYTRFENQTIKKHVAFRIIEFIFESYKALNQDQDQQFMHVLLLTQANEKIGFQDKCLLFSLLLQRIQIYTKALELDKLSKLIQPIFTEDLKKSFLQMSLYFIISHIERQAVQPAICDNFEGSLNNMLERFKSTFNETLTIFKQEKQEALLKFICIGDLFSAEEILPVLLMAAHSPYHKAKDYAEISLRGAQANIETSNSEVSEKIYKLIFNETYFYKDFPQREDHEIQPFSWALQIKLIDYLMKYEVSATQSPYNQKLVFNLFFSSGGLQTEKIGIQFLRHMIRYNNLQDEHDIGFLKQTILQIKGTQTYSEPTQAATYALLGDMAMKNFKILDDDIDIAISAFQALRSKVQQLEKDGYESIRSDDTALNYIESLNKYRDCYEKHLKDNNKRNLLLAYVLNYLNKEGKSNPELVYLLFLYLSKLDQGSNNSSVLLYSIILKDHKDIKIKKEAQYQLDRFEKEWQVKAKSEEEQKDQKQEESKKKILISFLDDIQMFFQRNQMDYLQGENQEQFEQFLSYTNAHFDLEFIDKIYDISHFVIKFFREEQKKLDAGAQEDVKYVVERLLLMNLNQNFQSVKSDFSKALDLINDYLKILGEDGHCTPVLYQIGWNFVYKLSIGSVHLPQRISSLKILIRILHSADKAYLQQILSKIGGGIAPQEKFTTLPQETKFNIIYQLTVLIRFYEKEQQTQYNEYFAFILRSYIDNPTLTPNSIEIIKFLFVCLRKIGEINDLSQVILGFDLLNQTLTFFTTQIKRKEIDINFRKHLISNVSGILKHAANDMKLKLAKEILQDLHDYENNDIQEQIGKMLSKVYFYSGPDNFADFINEMIELVNKNKETSILTKKRNSTIYLQKLVIQYGKSQKIVQEKFLDIQKVFLKFLFDRKQYMQDISSSALSMIYQMGSAEVKNQLVESLSQTLSGEKSAQQVQEKDENQELLLEFKDNTSTEQREKLKTYKDLCNIAVELGHRELIYQFLEVHRHLAHYQDIKNAAKGLSGILMLDERLRKDLLNIAPKILLLSYDHNAEVQETMKELWNNLIEIENEELIINNRWNEIYKEAFDGINSKEYRRRQSSALALSDLLLKRTWPQIKPRFRELFLHTLGLLDDNKDSVKVAAYQLIKTLQKMTLRLGNIYTNGNVQELEEVLEIVIPMILDECMKSNMKMVRFFSVDLLFEIVKTSQSTTMMTKLKLNNKYEKQLVFNYNSEQKMKEILNKYLGRITLEVIGNFSQMNKAVDTINQFEQLAIDQGYMNQKSKGKQGISEGDINDLKLKYTRDSTWGEILKICRDQMTEDTFNKILVEILSFMFKAHDTITRSTAVAFIQDIILENKLYLITPQNSKKIALKLIEVYSLSTVSAASSVKESLQNLYAQCLGLQMKILKEYPSTVKQLIESLTKLPKELEVILCLNIYEMSKNLPETMITENNGELFKEAIPIIYINNYNVNDHRLKELCKKTQQHLVEKIPQIIESHQNEIFKVIKDWLDSSSYDDRLAAAVAMQELITKLSEEDIYKSEIVKEVTDKLQQLIAGKYFNNKETIVEAFISLVKLNEKKLINDEVFVNSYVETSIKQIEKSSQSKLLLKNTLLKSLAYFLDKSQSIQQENKDKFFNLIEDELILSLNKISQTASMIENIDKFEEKRDEEKQTLQTTVEVYGCVPFLVYNDLQKLQQIVGISTKFYQITNWLVRNSIIKFGLQTLKLVSKVAQTNGDLINSLVELNDYLVNSVAEVGEKYDMNLKIISDITLIIAEKYQLQIKDKQRFVSNCKKIIELLKERGSEEMIKNIDLIKRCIEQDVEMKQ